MLHKSQREIYRDSVVRFGYCDGKQTFNFVNNIMENTDAPQVLVRVDYSEKLDLLTLSIRYQGDHHDPKDSDNELFLEMLEEPTTELIDQIIEPAYGIYNNLIQINFKWEEAQ